MRSSLCCDRKSRCSALIGRATDLMINASECFICRLQKKHAQSKLDLAYRAIGKKHFDEISTSPSADYKPLVDAVNAAKGEVEQLDLSCGSN